MCIAFLHIAVAMCIAFFTYEYKNNMNIDDDAVGEENVSLDDHDNNNLFLLL
ncbi:hypothetical protein ACJX0J_031118, partial [Zea mays]